MPNSLFSEENPFLNIKIRYILLCWFLALTGLSVQVVAICLATGCNAKTIDPIILLLITEFAYGLTIAWIIRQLKLSQIKVEHIIGKLSIHYHWLPIIGIVIARIVFSGGILRVFYYPLSFIFPSWIEEILSDDFLANASKSYSPAFFYFMLFFNNWIFWSIVEVFIFQGIILHRWAAKWGVKPAVILVSLVYSLLYSSNFLGGFSLGLMQTMFYIRFKNLIVPLVTRIINNVISFLLFFITLSGANKLEQVRSQLGIGVACLALLTPLLIWFLYKNRMLLNEPLPYFVNAKQSVDRS